MTEVTSPNVADRPGFAKLTGRWFFFGKAEVLPNDSRRKAPRIGQAGVRWEQDATGVDVGERNWRADPVAPAGR